ncbi:MAG: hypothetical protein J5671_08565 [Bacteroidaceae bacterium]|nr:hypothetical protein [Bacteroidaceae bacterium]
MKKIFFLSVAVVLMTACGGQSAKEVSGADSLSVLGDSVVAEAEPLVEEAVAEEATLNADLLGKWSNNNDPVIEMTVSDKIGKFEDWKGYGLLKAANEYFEYDFILVFTSVVPDGDNIRVSYNKMSQEFDGDPDDPDGEGQWITKKVGSGEMILVPAGAKKLKINSSDKRIRNAVLYK